MCLYLPDPMAVSNATGSRQEAKKVGTYKKDLEAKGVILPSTIDCVTGRRTELNLDISEQLPTSLLFSCGPRLIQVRMFFN